jgi:phosphatidylglycerol lysyltransferase
LSSKGQKAVRRPGPRRWLRALARLAATPIARAGLTLAILAVAAWLIRVELEQEPIGGVLQALAATPPWAPAAAVLFTLASYGCLALLEVFALRYIRRPLPLARVAPASACANGLSIAMGFGIASGTAVRLRLYGSSRLPARQIARLVLVLSAATFSSGMALLGAAALLRPASLAAALDWPRALVLVIALLLLAPLWLWYAAGRRRLSLRERATALAAALGSWIFSGGALFVLSPHRLSDLPDFFAAFMAGSLVGSVVGVPADLGVLDAAVLGLKSLGAAHQSAAGLILYRAVYHLGPLLIATAWLAARQLSALRPRPS